MTNNPLIPQSKLPQLGTTIFTRMSALAQQHQAINLSQGFPDFDGPRYLQERLAYHVAQGANQYAPMTGVQALREAIAQKTERLYGYQPDVDSNITVTAGATEALYAAITALVRNGDEVICFDPSYDSYALMNPLMILVKIIKLRWIHILSYDQMVSRKINNQTTRCANSIFYTTLFTNSAPNYT